METCEVCGKPTEVIYLAKIEEASMWVCASCARGKQILDTIDPNKQSRVETKGKRREEEVEELMENYGEEIRKARERLSLPLKVLAEKINEKESTLLRVERQKTLPNTKLTKKLEKELGIKLMVKSESASRDLVARKESPITLGDAAFKKESTDKKDGE